MTEGADPTLVPIASLLRRSAVPRARTLSIKRASKRELARGRVEHPERGYWRPSTRGECSEVERPCPFVACRWHLYLDVHPNGSVKLNFPHLEPEQLVDSCALDVADEGGRTLDAVASTINITRERVWQLETIVFTRKAYALRKLAAEFGIDPPSEVRRGSTCVDCGAYFDADGRGIRKRCADCVDADGDPPDVELPEVDREAQLAAARAAGLARGPAPGALVTLTAEQLAEVRIGRYGGKRLAPAPRALPPATPLLELVREPELAAQETIPAVLETAAGEGETTMRTATCEQCTNDFDVDTATGKLPKRCPTCKGGGAPKPKRTPRRRAKPAAAPERAAPLALRPPEQVEVQTAPFFRVRFRSLDIECSSGAALEELLQIVGRAS